MYMNCIYYCHVFVLLDDFVSLEQTKLFCSCLGPNQPTTPFRSRLRFPKWDSYMTIMGEESSSRYHCQNKKDPKLWIADFVCCTFLSDKDFGGTKKVDKFVTLPPPPPPPKKKKKKKKNLKLKK